ncbi:UNVERIFIED_CONTAM: hypothetical protein RMT77_003063 [Armadillidium vulgare]
MEFVTKIIFLTAVILMNSMYLSFQQEAEQKIEKKTPEERCTAVDDTVCVNCFQWGVCVQEMENETFTIENITDCEKTSAQLPYCDDSVFASGPFGMCAPYRPSFTNCSCSGVNTCNEDPNDPRVILKCDSGSPAPEAACPAAALNLTSCACSTCSESCPLLDDPNDDCPKFFFCNGNELIPSMCSPPLCFDQETCQCIDREATTTTSTTPTTPITNATTTTPTTNATTITPTTNATTTTPTSNATTPTPTTNATTTTPTTNGTTTTPTISATTPTPSTTTARITCKPGCPYAKDPADKCQKFFVCDRNSLVPLSCPGRLCFNEGRCLCT